MVKNNVLIHPEYKLETQFVILNSQQKTSPNKYFFILNNKLNSTIIPYSKDHSKYFESDNILLFDTFGRLRATFLPPFNITQITSDFIAIRDKYAEKCCIIPEQKKQVRFNYKDD